MEITAQHFEQFREIVNRFKDTTNFPEVDKWKSFTDDDYWIKVVTQISEVGNSLPGEKLNNSKECKARINYDRLNTLSSADEISTEIQWVLEKIGVRFQNKALDACLYNYHFFANNGSPKAYFTKLSTLESEIEKVNKLARDLKYFRHKSARDFLLALGMAVDLLAFDVRLQKIFKLLKLDLPPKFCDNAKKYREVEAALIQQVCRKLEITGAQLDRILFRNYDQIIKQLT